MKKLFEVEVTCTLYVLADSEYSAERVVESFGSSTQADEFESGFVSASQVTMSVFHHNASNLYDENGETIDETAEEYFSKWQEFERSRPRTRAELEAVGQQRLIVDL